MTGLITWNQTAVDSAATRTKLLTGLAALLFIALAVLLYLVNARQNILKDAMREDAIWATYQLDRETRQLTHLLSSVSLSDNPTANDMHALRTRYDVLYSRAKLLKTQQYMKLLAGDADLVQKTSQISEKIMALDAGIQTLHEGDKDTSHITFVLNSLQQLTKDTGDILVQANSLASTERAESRDLVLRLQTYSMLIAGAIILTFGALIYSLLMQVRMMSKASQEMRNTADALSISYEAAEAGNRTKSEFMATMGHEIRTPLNAILGMAEMLSYSKLSDDDRETVSVILSSGTSLLEIINEILDFAKLEDGKMTREAVPFRPHAIGFEVARVLRPRAAEKDTSIALELDGVQEDDCYTGDPTLLKRVLFNLISNAVKFTENGKIAVSIAWNEASSSLTFSVKDSGIGIPKSGLAKLFTPFTQVDNSTSRRFGGTGLGLAICKRIIEDMGGSIGVESILGLGSRFWFEVPTQRTQPVEKEVVLAETSALVHNKVLIVEDQPFNREVLTKFLHKLGQTADIACDGKEAVEAVRNNTYDIILMDMQMPEMDGVEATQDIRRFDTTTPIIALTANASETDKQRCLNAGMNGFEPKPLSLMRLEAVIRQYGMATAKVAPEGVEAKTIIVPVQLQAPDDEVVDQRRVQELLETLEADGFQALLESFMTELPKVLRDVEAALRTGDAEKLDEDLHNLKGLAGNFGLLRIASVAQEGRKQKFTEDSMLKLKAEIEIGCAAIRKFAA